MPSACRTKELAPSAPTTHRASMASSFAGADPLPGVQLALFDLEAYAVRALLEAPCTPALVQGYRGQVLDVAVK